MALSTYFFKKIQKNKLFLLFREVFYTSIIPQKYPFVKILYGFELEHRKTDCLSKKSPHKRSDFFVVWFVGTYS